MDPKEYLKQVVDALVNGNEVAAKEAHRQYIELKSKQLMKEGISKVETDENS
jgi:DNA-binding FadR family transcriptional regulator